MADLSYSNQGEDGQGSIRLSSVEGELSAVFQNTGRFVGEPNRGWQIDSFNSHRLGKLVFDKPGYYTISLELDPGGGDIPAFQWLWLEPIGR